MTPPRKITWYGFWRPPGLIPVVAGTSTKTSSTTIFLPSPPSRSALHFFLIGLLTAWHTSRARRGFFCSEFRLNFDGWTEEDFTPLGSPTLRPITLSKLKDVLVKHGLYCGVRNAKYAAVFANMVSSDQLPQWPIHELSRSWHSFTDNARSELLVRCPIVKSEVLKTPRFSTLPSTESPKSDLPDIDAPLGNDEKIAIPTPHDNADDIPRPVNACTAPILPRQWQNPSRSTDIQRPS
ncbi:hypothetical protein K3495_g1549 [Podosphaera aphanis]|nr:hypothetical protein K3495_g1549 [Podosphaera aphanis]